MNAPEKLGRGKYPRTSQVDETCPECGVVFRAVATKEKRGKVKQCPQGHVSSAAVLYRQRTMESVSMDVAARIGQLEVALREMLDCYTNAMRVAPKNTLAFVIIDGKFGNTPKFASAVLHGRGK